MKTHFRRCHMCLTVNSRENQLVERCVDCGKYLRSFLFFDEKQALDDEEANFIKKPLDCEESPPLRRPRNPKPMNNPEKPPGIDNKQQSNQSLVLKMHYPSLRGLTVYWSEE